MDILKQRNNYFVDAIVKWFLSSYLVVSYKKTYAYKHGLAQSSYIFITLVSVSYKKTYAYKHGLAQSSYIVLTLVSVSSPHPISSLKILTNTRISSAFPIGLKDAINNTMPSNNHFIQDTKVNP